MTKTQTKFPHGVLKSQARQYRKCLRHCRRVCSEPHVHRLRTRIRRLLALLELLAHLKPHPVFRKLRKELKNQLDTLDQLRDLQVMQQEIARAAETLPELTPFLKALQSREQTAIKDATAAIAHQRDGKFKQSLKKVVRRFKKADTNLTSNRAIATVIHDVYTNALERCLSLDDGNLAQIHHLRIALKKLRYMHEAAASRLPVPPPGLIDDLTLIGEIQNSVILINQLRGFFAESLPPRIEDNYQNRQLDLIAQFMQRRDDIARYLQQGCASECNGD